MCVAVCSVSVIGFMLDQIQLESQSPTLTARLETPLLTKQRGQKIRSSDHQSALGSLAKGNLTFVTLVLLHRQVGGRGVEGCLGGGVVAVMGWRKGGGGGCNNTRA